MTEVRHPLFARLYPQISRLMERDLAVHRDEMLSGLSGRVVEIGAGNGMSFGHYPATVDEVIAIEPEPYLHHSAVQSASEAAVKVTVLDGLAEALPLDDGGFDAAVTGLVLCTVPDQASALAELRRVLSPGAELRFLEHARADHPVKVRIQKGADLSRIWPSLAGGCHCARETVGAIRAAGFEVAQVHSFDLVPSWGLTNPHVRGVARSPR